jgi:hypothetical protein
MVYDLKAFSEDFFKRNNITYEQLVNLLATMKADECQNHINLRSSQNLSVDD